MTVLGETLASGAPKTCPDCGITVSPEVLSSAAGHYVGTRCNCGPYTRESGYYVYAQNAQDALDAGTYRRPGEKIQ
jgi:hypothetical protein